MNESQITPKYLRELAKSVDESSIDGLGDRLRQLAKAESRLWPNQGRTASIISTVNQAHELLGLPAMTALSKERP